MKTLIQSNGVFFALILAATIFFGCANENAAGTVINFAPGVQATLPPPFAETPFHREQLLSAAAGGKTQVLHVALDADSSGITLVGFSTLGIRLFKATYDKTGITTQQLVPLGEMPPAPQVLGDIMLAYQPIHAWKNHLPANWTLTDDNAARRSLRDAAGNVVTEIDYLQEDGMREPVRIRQHPFNYEIQITNLE